MGYNYETRVVETQAFMGGTCDRCQAPIPKLHEDDYFSTNMNGGMTIQAHGWYGGLIDPIGIHGGMTKLLCSTCGTEFMDTYFPEWWSEFVRPEEIPVEDASMPKKKIHTTHPMRLMWRRIVAWLHAQ